MKGKNTMLWEEREVNYKECNDTITYFEMTIPLKMSIEGEGYYVIEYRLDGNIKYSITLVTDLKVAFAAKIKKLCGRSIQLYIITTRVRINNHRRYEVILTFNIPKEYTDIISN